MTRVARLSADLVANSSSFESSLKRANRAMNQSKQQWNSALGTASRSFTTFDKHVRSSIGSIVDLKSQLGNIAALTASALSIQKIVKYSDTWRQLEGRLSIVSGSMEDVARAQEDLFKIAQRTRQPLEAVSNLYVRLNNVLDEQQKKQFDILGITETINLALAVTGEGGAQAASAILQFSQAVQSDFKSSAQEINSLLDSAPRLAQALQRSLGDGTKSLKELAKDGELSTAKVLRALEPIAAEGQKIRSEFAKTQTTVGQALTQLDNAFLKFIGQTGLIASGTSSLAGGIQLLANNFGTLATAAAAVGLAFAGNLGFALLGVARNFVIATARTTAFNFALGTLAFGSRAASLGMVALSGATTALSGAIALLGGPLGVALISTFAIMQLGAYNAGKAQREMNKILAEHQVIAAEFITANEERQQSILNSTKANIQNLKTELKAINLLYQAYNEKSFTGRFFQNLGANVGLGKGVKDIVSEGAALERGISTLENELAKLETIKKTQSGSLNSPVNTEITKSQKETIAKILEDLKEESAQIELQTKLYGQKESAIEAAQKALKIEQQLQAAGITLTKDQQAAIDGYLQKIEEQNAIYNEQARIQEDIEQKEKDRQQAINQLGASFSSAFEQAIVDGGKLSDVLDGLLNDILRIITRVTVTEPLGNAVTDIFSGGTSGGGGFSLGGFFSDFLGNLPSFDVGTDYVPYDMVAKIHKGEKIVPAGENGGGGNVMVVINNNTGAQVNTSSRNGPNGTELTVMIDQAVADNISRKGSRTNQALNAYSQQGLTRR